MSRIESKALKSYPWHLRLLFSMQKKKYGSPLKPMLLWGRHPRLLLLFLRMGRFFKRKHSLLHSQLQVRVMLKVSEINQCPFCIDLNRSLIHGKPLGDVEVALKYAEAMIDTGKKVSDELFDELKAQFSEDQIVELTALIGYQDLSSKFNAALNVEPHGFCKKTSIDT